MTVKANIVPISSDHVSFYRFKSGIDADLEFICEAIVKSGLSATEIKAQVSKAGGHISTSTISHWLDGTTRRPQNYTLSWVAFALDYEKKWIKTA